MAHLYCPNCWLVGALCHKCALRGLVFPHFSTYWLDGPPAAAANLSPRLSTYWLDGVPAANPEPITLLPVRETAKFIDKYTKRRKRQLHERHPSPNDPKPQLWIEWF